MWVPRSWEAIAGLIGSAEETSSLDFKREITSNKEIAKDVAAMSVDGGVIVYGIEEDQSTRRAASIHKMPLGGLEEKFSQVIGSRITPPLQADVVPLTEGAGDTEGVVVVIVPASASGPHMVDDRYPCRRGTTTGYLSEPEVDRAYQRRTALTHGFAEPDQVMEDFVGPPTADRSAPDPGIPGGAGYLRLQVTPSSTAHVHPSSPWMHEPLQRAFHDTVSALGPRLRWDRDPPALAALDGWRPRGTASWVAGGAGGEAQKVLKDRTSGASFTHPNRISFLATWPLEVPLEGGGTYRVAYEVDVGLAVAVYLSFAGQLLGQLHGLGPVQCAAQFLGFGGAVSFRTTRGRPNTYTVGLPEATDHSGGIISTALEMAQSPEVVAARLVDPWLVPFYQWDALWPHILEPAAI